MNTLLRTVRSPLVLWALAFPAIPQGISTRSVRPPNSIGPRPVQQSNHGVPCNTVTFEGVGDLAPIGTLTCTPDVTFGPSWLGLVDADSGGGGNFANEPSPDTVAFFLDPADPIDFSAGVQTIQVYYCASAASIPVFLTAYDGVGGTGTVVDVAIGTTVGKDTDGANCTGDPSGNYCLWDVMTLTSATPNIRSMTLEGAQVNDFGFDNLTFVSGFQITDPADQSRVHLTEANRTETPDIEFKTTPVAGNPDVDWTATLEYATSGGRGSSTQTITFRAGANDSTTKTYASKGGRVTLDATTTISGSAAHAPTVRFYVAGTAIPNADITSRLISLYSGPTANLMTGIAQKESSYRQFFPRTLFGIQDLWPNESYDGGSHIGLMQVATQLDVAWSWESNTAAGVSLYELKRGVAGRVETRIRNQNPGLRALTGVENENMALVLYGPFASGDLKMQYYIPGQVGGGIDWVENTANNPRGVAYAKDVRNHVH